MQITVKELEWVKHPTAEAWRADTMLGTYQVWVGSHGTAWQFDGLLGEYINEPVSGMEVAQASAQDHFNRCIHSSLSPAPQPVGEVRDTLPAGTLALSGTDITISYGCRTEAEMAFDVLETMLSASPSPAAQEDGE